MRNDAALRHLERAIKERPTDAALHHRLGRAYMDQEDVPDALRCFEKAATLAPHFARAHFDCGLAYTRMGSLDLAVREWQKMVDEDGDLDLEGATGARPAHVAAALRDWERYRQTAREDIFKHYHLGLAMLVLSRPAEALAEFDEVVAANPSFEKVRYYRGAALMMMARPLEASDEFGRSADGKARDPQARYQAGAALLEAGRTVQAMTSLQRALEEWPRHVKALYRLAQAHVALFQLDQAVKLLQQALEIRPGFAEGHFELGRCLEKQYSMDAAVQAYERAAELRPEYREVHFQLGLLYKTLGRHDQALEHLRTCVALDPKEAEAYYYTGTILAALGRHEEAISEYRKAVNLSPRHAYACYALGQACMQVDRLEEARVAFDRALAINPRDVQARSALGLACFKQGQLNLAIRQFESILQVNPRDPEAHYFLGAAWARLGHFEEAMEAYRKASSVEPGSALEHFGRGASLSREGDAEGALEAFHRAAQVRPGSEADLGLYSMMQLLATVGVDHARRAAHLADHAEQLDQVYLRFVEVLSGLLDARTPYTRGHSSRVSILGTHLARVLGLPWEQQKAVQIGAYLHDLGKLDVPDFVLQKEGRLTPAEQALVRHHPDHGAVALEGVPFPWEVLPIVRHHHENWDGSGYPDGLKGDQIPLPAQVVGLVDYYDGLTSHRPYRPAFTPREALVQIQGNAGLLFNPVLVEVFEESLDDLVLLVAPEPPGEGAGEPWPEGGAAGAPAEGRTSWPEAPDGYAEEWDGLREGAVDWDDAPTWASPAPGGSGSGPEPQPELRWSEHESTEGFAEEWDALPAEDEEGEAPVWGQ